MFSFMKTPGGITNLPITIYGKVLLLIQDCDMKFGSWTYSGFKVASITDLPFIHHPPSLSLSPSNIIHSPTFSTTELHPSKKMAFFSAGLEPDNGLCRTFNLHQEWWMAPAGWVSSSSKTTTTTTIRTGTKEKPNQECHQRGTRCLLTGSHISTSPSP